MNDEYKTRLGHRERVRQKVFDDKMDGMSDVEILEALLFGSLPRVDTNAIARRLLAAFGSFDAVLDASYYKLVEIDGVGDAVAMQLLMIPEICRRYRVAKVSEKDMLDTWGKLTQFLKPHLDCKTKEEIHILLLGVGHKLIKHIKMEEGIENQVYIYNKKICRMAMEKKAVSVVLAHNHPAANVYPSFQDDEMTYDLFRGLHALDIALIDHLIVGNDKVYSYHNSDRLQELFSRDDREKMDAMLAAPKIPFNYNA